MLESLGLDTLPLDVLVNILEGLDCSSLLAVRLVRREALSYLLVH
jgi:hypothetical protein